MSRDRGIRPSARVSMSMKCRGRGLRRSYSRERCSRIAVIQGRPL
ncbi:hypothetical protein LC55x_3055 [Lysobacter capsici]|nr:hypothetical protein LC55x_3055 [Lysobacter capsici]